MHFIKICLVKEKRFTSNRGEEKLLGVQGEDQVKRKTLRDCCHLSALVEVNFVLKGFILGPKHSNTTAHRGNYSSKKNLWAC